MPIIRTIPTSNFTVLNNAIANDALLSGSSTAILIYLISKPPYWRFNARDIKRRFNIGMNKVYRCMRELIQAGYATYKRVQSACHWFIYDTPQNKETATDTAVIDRVNFEHVKNKCVLEITEKTVNIEKPLPEASIRGSESVQGSEIIQNVVVDLIFPEQLTEPQKKSAKHIIKKVKQPELQQPVLFALAYAITNGTVKSAPAYLQGLVTRANAGTFEPVGAATTINQGGKPLIPVWQGFGASTPSKPEAAKRFLQQAKAALVVYRNVAN